MKEIPGDPEAVDRLIEAGSGDFPVRENLEGASQGVAKKRKRRRKRKPTGSRTLPGAAVVLGQNPNLERVGQEESCHWATITTKAGSRKSICMPTSYGKRSIGSDFRPVRPRLEETGIPGKEEVSQPTNPGAHWWDEELAPIEASGSDWGQKIEKFLYPRGQGGRMENTPMTGEQAVAAVLWEYAHLQTLEAPVRSQVLQMREAYLKSDGIERERACDRLTRAQERLSGLVLARDAKLRSLLYTRTPIVIQPLYLGGASDSLDATGKQIVGAAIGEFARFVTASKGRAHTVSIQETSGPNACKGKTLFLNRVDLNPAAVIHLLGHWLEAEDPHALMHARGILHRRSSGKPLKPLGLPYAPWERFYEGAFPIPYMGKECGAMTEVTATGVELYFRDPYGFAAADPKGFAHLFDTLRGNI